MTSVLLPSGIFLWGSLGMAGTARMWIHYLTPEETRGEKSLLLGLFAGSVPEQDRRKPEQE